MRRYFVIVVLILISLVGLAACGPSPAPTAATEAVDDPPRVTPSPSPAPTIPTPPPPLDERGQPHPLSIDYLRARDYPGSDFVTEQALAPGINYTQAVVSYQSDGLTIYALLTVPQGPAPPGGFPVIIFNHGYIPPEIYRTTERYEAYVDAFARNGYIVVKPDYRGHGFSEGEPESAYGSPGYVIDVLNALATARRHPQADPQRVGMWGHSMGGFITLRAMVVDPTIRAGVIWAGVVVSYADLFADWFRNRRSWRGTIVEQYGLPQDNPQFWAALSANSYLHELSGPVQIHHGTGDTVVPYAFSVTLDDEIRLAGGHTELVLYDRDDHNIARNRDIALVTSVVFFDQHVRGAN